MQFAAHFRLQRFIYDLVLLDARLTAERFGDDRRGVVVAVSGKIAMTEAVRRATPQAFLRGPTLVLGPKGRFMFGSAVEYGNSGDKRRGDLEPPSTCAAAEMPWDREQYVMWGFPAGMAPR